MDNRGQERAGTRTAPGTPAVDCDRPGETSVKDKFVRMHRYTRQEKKGMDHAQEFAAGYYVLH